MHQRLRQCRADVTGDPHGEGVNPVTGNPHIGDTGNPHVGFNGCPGAK